MNVLLFTYSGLISVKAWWFGLLYFLLQKKNLQSLKRTPFHATLYQVILRLFPPTLIFFLFVCCCQCQCNACNFFWRDLQIFAILPFVAFSIAKLVSMACSVVDREKNDREGK